MIGIVSSSTLSTYNSDSWKTINMQWDKQKWNQNKNGTKTKTKVKRNIKKTNKENELVDRETKKNKKYFFLLENVYIILEDIKELDG